MMWKPNSVRTTSEIAPGRRRNATSSDSFTITPLRNPAARSCAWNSGIEVNCLRTFWTVCSTASCTSWSVTLIVVSRSACCTSNSSSTICERIWRRAASRPAESAGTFAPCDCARTSCSSTCDARIGFVPTTATMRSTGRSVAARPCAAAGVPQGETAASTATTMVRTRARMSARRLPAAALRRDRRRARRPLQTRGCGRARRRVRRPDRLCTLQRPRDSRLVHRPRLVLAERAGQEGRDRVERCAAPGHRLVHVPVDARHGELHARGGGCGGVLEELGRDVQQALEARDSRVVLGAQAPPVVRAEPHGGLVHLYEQHLTLREHLDELVQLGVARRGDPAHVVRVKRQGPPRPPVPP